MKKRGQQSNITDEQIQLLESIGFKWSIRQSSPNKLATPWSLRFAELEEFVELNGHADVPAKHPSLGKWVENQRTQFRMRNQGLKSPMNEERIQQLESIGFKWKIGSKQASKEKPKSVKAKTTAASDEVNLEEPNIDMVVAESSRGPSREINGGQSQNKRQQDIDVDEDLPGKLPPRASSQNLLQPPQDCQQDTEPQAIDDLMPNSHNLQASCNSSDYESEGSFHI